MLSAGCLKFWMRRSRYIFSHALALEDVRGAIDFDQVYFRYSENVPVIDQVSFHVPAGALCVVVGSSGQGSQHWLTCYCVSTIPNREPSGSTGTTCGISVSSLAPAYCRGGANPLLLSSERAGEYCVRQAGCFARGDSRLLQGGRHRRFHSVVARTLRDHAWGTRFNPVCRRTATIALARALLRDPAILIMDEPSSALDPVSEAAITSVFGRVLRGRTAILSPTACRWWSGRRWWWYSTRGEL